MGELFASDAPLVVVLDGIQDPGNVGTIVRIAAAFDASGVAVTEGSADPFAPKALRASAGSALALPIVQTTRAALLRELETRRIPLWAAVAGAAGRARPTRPAAIVFGSEGQGVSEDLLAVSKEISVPISPRVESLNVSAAAAIVLHEIWCENETRYHLPPR
jgi:TrmH family RNA methyltransferase